jgi:hypothetical protein
LDRKLFSKAIIVNKALPLSLTSHNLLIKSLAIVLTAENECGSDTHVSEEGGTSVVYNRVGYE